MAWDNTRRRVDAHTRWEEIACPVCDGEAFTFLFEKLGEPFVRCEGCGLVMINPRPVFAEVQRTYDADYSRGYVRKRAKKLRRIGRWVRRIRRRHAARGRWLDVGCSAGFVVYCAQRAGFEAWGVDVEPAGLEYGRRELGLEHLHQGLLEEQRFPGGHFDVISAYDLIEHVPDLNAFVAELARLLAPEGVLDIRTPDVGHWRVPRRLETWEAILPSEHLYNFDRRTLTRLLARHGLAVVECRFNLKPGLKVCARHAR